MRSEEREKRKSGILHWDEMKFCRRYVNNDRKRELKRSSEKNDHPSFVSIKKMITLTKSTGPYKSNSLSDTKTQRRL